MATWDPLDKRARHAIALAGEVAKRQGFDRIDTRHILAGLIEAGDAADPALHALESSSVTADRFWEADRAVCEQHPPAAGTHEMVFNSRAKAAIEQAFNEKAKTKAKKIGTGHLLLALLGDDEGEASAIFDYLGVDREAMRTTVSAAIATKEAQAHTPEPPEPTRPFWEPVTDRTREPIIQAQREALAAGHSFVGAAHILIALSSAADEQTAAAILSRHGVTAEVLRSHLSEVFEATDHRDEAMTFRPDAKHVIEMAFEKTRRLQHNSIGVEHLLLGLLSFDNSGTELLAKVNVDREGLQRALLSQLGVDER